MDPLCFRRPWKTKINVIFKYQLIFRHILEYFFARKWNLRSVTESIRSIRYQRGKLKFHFFYRSIGFVDCLWILEDTLNLRQDRSKNKVVGENALTGVVGARYRLRNTG